MAEETVNPNANEDEIDGCDVEIEEKDVTPDEDLPAAEGGVG